jgi:hypothetical protein
MVRNILLFIVMDGAGGAGGAREEGLRDRGTGNRGQGRKTTGVGPGPGNRGQTGLPAHFRQKAPEIHWQSCQSPGRGAFRPTFPQNGYALERREAKTSATRL